jgi:hypothetical protein
MWNIYICNCIYRLIDTFDKSQSRSTWWQRVKGLGRVSINIGPVSTQKLKFCHFQFFLVGIICSVPLCIEWHLFWKMLVRIVNIESTTGAIFRIFLNFTEFELGHTFVSNFTCVSLNLYWKKKCLWKFGNLNMDVAKLKT